MRHAGQRFLVTARHVLWDKSSADREYEQRAQRVGDTTLETYYEQLLYSTEIFSIIFRVPTLDEVLASSSNNPEHLMNLGAGLPANRPHTFSTPDLDLAVIALDQRNKRFAEALESQGYVAISSEQFSTAPTGEGADVYTVGFPSAIALVGERSLLPAKTSWSSKFVSVPTFAFGKVSMLHPHLPFFWCDMSAYPGNSGGPVIEDHRRLA